jgi:hypothetical protein
MTTWIFPGGIKTNPLKSIVPTVEASKLAIIKTSKNQTQSKLRAHNLLKQGL